MKKLTLIAVAATILAGCASNEPAITDNAEVAAARLNKLTEECALTSIGSTFSQEDGEDVPDAYFNCDGNTVHVIMSNNNVIIHEQTPNGKREVLSIN